MISRFKLPVEDILDEVIDLRPIVEGLLRYWRLIVGSTLILIIGAIGITLMLPDTYEATALVAIIENRERVQFDERFAEEVFDQPQLLLAYPELAMSDEVLSTLLAQLPAEADIETLADLQDMLSVTAGSDPGLLHLTAKHKDSEVAAAIANNWAQLFMTLTNRLNGNRGEQQVLFFEERLLEAQTVVEATEQELIDFQERNRFTIIENELNALTQLQTDYLADRRAMLFTLTDVNALKNQLQNSDTPSITLADQVTALTLQIKAFDVELELPLQFQLDNADVTLTSSSRTDQIALLDDLQNTLESSLNEIDNRLTDLEPQILQKQREREQVQLEYGQLQRNRNVAEETYLSLARKVDEERITAQDVSGGVRLASNAAVPMEPAGPTVSVIAAIAGVIGLLLGFSAILALTWWRRTRSAAQEVEAERLNASLT